MAKKQLTCTHTRRTVEVSIDPASEPFKSHDRITLAFRCRDCSAAREFAGTLPELEHEISKRNLAGIEGDPDILLRLLIGSMQSLREEQDERSLRSGARPRKRV